VENHKHFCQDNRCPDKIRSGVFPDTSRKRYCLNRQPRCAHAETRITYIYRVYDRKLWSKILIEKPLAFYGTQKSITMFTAARQCTLSRTLLYPAHDLIPYSLTTLLNIALSSTLCYLKTFLCCRSFLPRICRPIYVSPLNLTIHKYIYILSSSMSVTVDGVLYWIFDLLTALPHNS
jgi:hypothetical protein